MSQAKRKKIEGQQRAIAEHEAKKLKYPHPDDKAFAQRTVEIASTHLNKLQKKKGK
jgi:hypothetical protein